MQILIVDDHALFRECLCHVLNQMEDDVTIVETSSCDQAFQYAKEQPNLDLVLLDLNMPDINGFEGLDLFASRFPALPIVILSASNLHSDVQKAMKKGAVGFIHKDISTSAMLKALRIILSGDIYVPPNMTQQQQSREKDKINEALTPKQQEVLSLLATGHSNKVIAAEMSLSEATVKMHITAIFKCLNVSNRTQAALEVEKLGL